MIARFSVFRLLLGLYLVIWLINLKVFGVDANQVQKGIGVATAISFLLTRRVDKFVLFLVAAIFIITFACALLSDYYLFSFGRYLSSLISLSAILLLLPARPTHQDRKYLLLWLGWAPVCCVAIGAIYDSVGLWPLWRQDFLGVLRLQGSTISAGLGTIGYVGVIAAVLSSVYYDRRYLALAGINVVILALSAARMPFAMAVMCSVVIYYYYYGRSFARLYFATGALGLVAAAGYFLIGDRIIARFESESSSGREIIWEVLQSELSRYPYFGIGLGHQITVIPEDIIEKTATFAAHNEYLRLGVETGYIGVCAIMAVFALLFTHIFLTRAGCRNPVFVTIVASFFVYCYTDNVISSNTAIFSLVMAGAMSVDEGNRRIAKNGRRFSSGRDVTRLRRSPTFGHR